MHIHKAYLNAKGGPAVLSLTHDVKRCIADCGVGSGHVLITSTQGTTAVALLENDKSLQIEYLEWVSRQLESASMAPVSRRSRTGPNAYHLMAAFVGLSLVVPFDRGALLSSAFHDVVALDFEPNPGRREFVMTVMGSGGK